MDTRCDSVELNVYRLWDEYERGLAGITSHALGYPSVLRDGVRRTGQLNQMGVSRVSK